VPANAIINSDASAAERPARVRPDGDVEVFLEEILEPREPNMDRTTFQKNA